MRADIRRAALRAAAKATLVMSVGCSGAPPPTTAPANASPDTAAAAPPPSCDEHLDGLAVVTPDKLPADDPLKSSQEPVYRAFADIAARTSARTRECCTAALDRDGADAKHRWECCSAVMDPERPGAHHGCTPWGPPCPPAMIG